MFKGYHNSVNSPLYRSFPNLNFQTNVSAYGYSGVSFWLDASFGLNTQTNLGAVSRWQPIIGRSPFIQDTAANQPRFIASDVNYNNFPSVEAQDTGRFMTADNGLIVSNGDVTIAIVSKINVDQIWNAILSRNGDTNLTGIIDGKNNAVSGFGYINAGSNILIGTTESLNPRIKIISKNNIIVNGINETTGTFNISTELNRIFRLGTIQNLVGTITEIIAFNFSMTSQQCIDLSNNINQKYALY